VVEETAQIQRKMYQKIKNYFYLFMTSFDLRYLVQSDKELIQKTIKPHQQQRNKEIEEILLIFRSQSWNEQIGLLRQSPS